MAGPHFIFGHTPHPLRPVAKNGIQNSLEGVVAADSYYKPASLPGNANLHKGKAPIETYKWEGLFFSLPITSTTYNLLHAKTHVFPKRPLALHQYWLTLKKNFPSQGRRLK